jgi:hypothetical protein
MKNYIVVMLLFLLPCHCFDCLILRVAGFVFGDYVLMIIRVALKSSKSLKGTLYPIH